jgi:predicted DNA-binding WGR domain protein
LRRFEFSQGSSHKFWEIALSGSSLTTRWGRIGAAGQSQTRSFASEAEATEALDKLIEEKRRKGYREVAAEGEARPREAAASAPADAELLRRDLILRGKSHHTSGSLMVHGWVEIARGGKLVCGGDLICLGAFIDEGAELQCRELVTNFLEVDNSGRDTTVKVERIRARVVHVVQLALADIIARGDLTADYCQHSGGELNPSWDYTRGDLTVLRPEFYEYVTPDDATAPVLFCMNEIRAALCAGENVFDKLEPLVSLMPRPPAHPIEHPTLAEFAAWLDEHPGPQRVILDDLRAQWFPRLVLLDAEARKRAEHLISRTIKSPKLAEARAALLQSLSSR